MAKKKASSDPTSAAVEALTRAAANAVPLKLHGTAKSPGIFLSAAQGAKDAARLCVERGWLQGTGEFSGKGKSAAELFHITPAGVEFALENGEVPALLNDLLLAGDSQRETLQRVETAIRSLQDELRKLGTALPAQKELLARLKVESRRPSVAQTATPNAADSTAWLEKVVQYVRSFRQRTPHFSCSFSELFREIATPAGLSVGQFHDGLRRLSRERRIVLEPWTGAMSDLTDDHLALVMAKETKFYADPV